MTKLDSSVAPGADLSAVKKVHVVRSSSDDRGIDRVIAEQITLLGRTATHGAQNQAPGDADAIVTYQDKWMWDITMYMIELNIQVRDPRSEVALASGHSLRTSLARRSPPEMAKEVLSDLFKRR